MQTWLSECYEIVKNLTVHVCYKNKILNLTKTSTRYRGTAQKVTNQKCYILTAFDNSILHASINVKEWEL